MIVNNLDLKKKIIGYMIANGYRIALGGDGGGAALLYGEAEQKEISD